MLQRITAPSFPLRLSLPMTNCHRCSFIHISEIRHNVFRIAITYDVVLDVQFEIYDPPTELRAGLARYFGFYNTRRRHSALDRRTPDAVYFDQAHRDLAA